MTDDHEPETGINEMQWMARRIELHYVQHGCFPSGLCLEYAQKFGTQAERNLIHSIAAQGL